MTQFIGFPHYGDEYKVMGLAPYGEPRYVDAMQQIVRALKNDGTFALDLRYFRHAAGEGANYQGKDGIPSGGRLWSDALARAARAGARSGGAARGSPSRHRALGAGDVRERLLPSAAGACTAATAPTPSCWPAAAP